MQLNLPEQKFKIKNVNQVLQIFDSLRSKYVVLTPEEWVRQNFVAYLINQKQYPESLINNEISLLQNGIKRRCDTLIIDQSAQPLVIVEYKAPSIKITQKVFDQIVRYNMALHAKCLIVSNGLQHFCCRIDYTNNTYSFLPDIPAYAEVLAFGE